MEVRMLRLTPSPEIAFDFGDYVSENHEFLAWFPARDTAIIATGSGQLLIWAVAQQPELLEEIDLRVYGIRPTGLYSVVARPLE
jgi:hypothetical protein